MDKLDLRDGVLMIACGGVLPEEMEGELNGLIIKTGRDAFAAEAYDRIAALRYQADRIVKDMVRPIERVLLVYPNAPGDLRRWAEEQRERATDILHDADVFEAALGRRGIERPAPTP